MNVKAIQNLIKLLKESDLESISYKDKDLEIEVKRPLSSTVKEMMPTPIREESIAEAIKGETIKSMLVGIFYSKPSPDMNAFVSVGDKVNQGDVLCIIEAMKVMNEIRSPKAGIIEAIHVEEGDMVDFDQPLFTIL